MEQIASKVSSANRMHIGVFGRMNVGKSTFVNRLTGQEVSIVSDREGTTTDVVKKPMEINGIGAVLFLDTAGFDDEATELGKQRVAASRKAAATSDVCVMLFGKEDDALEKEWVESFLSKGIGVLGVIAKKDTYAKEELSARFESLSHLHIPLVAMDGATGEGVDDVRKELVKLCGDRKEERTILGNLVAKGDVVLLVMPQDPQAPQARLIQPQVQTIRELLDRGIVFLGATMDNFSEALAALEKEPDLIVTDSQCFAQVNALKPAKSRLTSFSVLFAAYKGDIRYCLEGTKTIDALKEGDKVLIAEICTHAPMKEDIGREKIPALLRKRAGKNLQIDVCAGSDFPENIKDYALIIQCGGCMFNRRHILSRIQKAKDAGVPMTNYGLAIAHLNGMLDKVVLPDA